MDSWVLLAMPRLEAPKEVVWEGVWVSPSQSREVGKWVGSSPESPYGSLMSL